MAAVLSLTLSLAFVVTVSGDPDCPTADAVHEAMARILDASDTALREVRVDVSPSSVVVSVLGEHNEVLAQKSLPSSYSCEERAQAAAVFATTWDAAASVLSPLSDVAVAVTPPVPEGMDLEEKASRRETPPPAPWALRTVLGAMGVAGSALASGGQALGLSADLVVRPAPSWGVRTELFRLWPRSLALAEGEAQWRRLGVAAGLLGRVPQSWGSWIGDASAVLSYTSVEGRNFAVNSQSNGWVPGGRLALGLDLVIAAPWSVALELAGILWASDEQAVAKESAARRGLPRADLLLRLSVAFEKNFQ